jgi:enamine deaminase RidA (YjgF/YER057c/UK114 family)
MIKETLENCRYASFKTEAGAQEAYILITTNPSRLFAEALAELEQSFSQAMMRYELSSDHLQFSRLYLSDLENQKEQLKSSALFSQLSSGALACVQQPPVNGGAINLFAYFVNPGHGAAVRKTTVVQLNDDWRNGILSQGRHYSLLWTANYSDNRAFDSEVQTDAIFDDYTSLLAAHGMNMLDNGVRTWIYVRDIDNHYKGMVKARREHFSRGGLTAQTRYLASTGIEGKGRQVSALVTMDALAIGGLSPAQIVRMEAPEHMSPTIQYGVTFERGLAVRYGDRSHLYVSGTASIDKEGNVLHHGDVQKQTGRMLENVEALLAQQKASMTDMAYLYLYLRDPAFYDGVMEVIRQRVPADIPLIVMHGPVCRPAWLVEIEGVAIVKESNPFPAFL